jgi:hypothetical protein
MTTTQNNDSGFLTLPTEILLQILDLVIPVQHLRLQHLIDLPSTTHDSPSGIPSVFFLTKPIYQQAAPIFYSRAVLGIAPLRPPSYLFKTLSAPSLKLNLRTGLDILFASCNPDHLGRISTVNICSGQADAINAEAYEALLGWLVDNTAVTNIQLSNRLMTRLRKGRTHLNSSLILTNITPPPAIARTVYIYSRHRRSPWEILRMAELRRALNGRQLPTIQSFLFQKCGDNDPLLDPRWDVRKSDDDERLLKMDKVASFLDGLITADPVHSTQPATADPRLCQILFVLEPTHLVGNPTKPAITYLDPGIDEGLDTPTHSGRANASFPSC